MTTKKKKPFWVKLLSAVLVASMLIGNAGMSSFAAADSPDEKGKVEETVSDESAGGKENTAGTPETGAAKEAAQDLEDTGTTGAGKDTKTPEGADVSDAEGNLQSKEEAGKSDAEDNQQSKEEAGTSDVEESLKDKAEGDVSSETGDENAPSDATDTENGGVTPGTSDAESGITGSDVSSGGAENAGQVAEDIAEISAETELVSEEVPVEVQAFLDAVAQIPTEITLDNMEEVAELLYGIVSETYEVLLGTECEEREDVQAAVEVMAAAIAKVDELAEIDTETYAYAYSNVYDVYMYVGQTVHHVFRPSNTQGFLGNSYTGEVFYLQSVNNTAKCLSVGQVEYKSSQPTYNSDGSFRGTEYKVGKATFTAKEAGECSVAYSYFFQRNNVQCQGYQGYRIHVLPTEYSDTHTLEMNVGDVEPIEIEYEINVNSLYSKEITAGYDNPDSDIAMVSEDTQVYYRPLGSNTGVLDSSIEAKSSGKTTITYEATHYLEGYSACGTHNNIPVTFTDTIDVTVEEDTKDTTYKTIREYYMNGEKVARVEGGLISGNVGDVIEGAALANQNPDWKNRTVDGKKIEFDYVGCSPDPSLTLGKNADQNVITLRYEKNNLVVTKTPSEKYPLINREFKYTIKVENPGTESVKVTITDKLNEKLDFVSASDGGSYNKDTGIVTWTEINVLANGSKEVNVQVKANRTGEIDNEAEINGTNIKASGKTTVTAKREFVLHYNEKPGSDTGTAQVTKMPTPNPSDPTASENMSYTLKISDTVPERGGYTFKHWQWGDDPDKIYAPGADITLTADAETQEKVTAELYAVWEKTDDFEVKKERTSGDTAKAGDTITWNIIITNKSKTTDKTVIVEDILGGAIGSAVVKNGESTIGKNDKVTVPKGSSVTLTASYDVKKEDVGKTITNKVKVTDEEDKDHPKEADDGPGVTVDGTPELTITKEVDKASVKVGNPLTYTITVKNDGDGDAENVEVSDTLPAELADNIQRPTPASYTMSVVDGKATFTWNLGTVEAGKYKTVEFTVKTEKAGRIENGASVKSDEITTPVETEEPAKTTIYDLEVTKKNDGFKVNEATGTAAVHYTVTVENKSGFALYGLDIIDTLATEVKDTKNDPSNSVKMTLKPVSLKLDGKDIGTPGDESEPAANKEGQVRTWNVLPRSEEFKDGSTVTLVYDIEIENTGDTGVQVKLDNRAKGGSWTTGESSLSPVRKILRRAFVGLGRSSDPYDAEDEDGSSASGGTSSTGGFIPVKKTFELVYDLKGGSNGPENQTVTTTQESVTYHEFNVAGKETSAAIPTNGEKVFKGWAETEGGDVVYAFDSETKSYNPEKVTVALESGKTASKTLYAVWAEPTRKITVKYWAEGADPDNDEPLKTEIITVIDGKPIVDGDKYKETDLVTVEDIDKDGNHYIVETIPSSDEKTVAGDVVIDVICTLDNKTDEENDGNGDKPGDGIPDKYQKEVKFVAVNGSFDPDDETVTGKTVVVTLFDSDNKPSENGIGHLTEEQIPEATPNTDYEGNGTWNPEIPTVEYEITEDKTFTIVFTNGNALTVGAGDVTVTYDGAEHPVVPGVNDPDADVKVEYRRTDENGDPVGDPLDEAPKDAGTYIATITATLPDGTTASSKAKVVINKRGLTVTTGSGSKTFDNTPLTNSTATVTVQDGNVDGEIITATATGSQTAVGSSTNGYEIDWDALGINPDNYEITAVLGTLTVNAAAPTTPSTDGGETGGGGGTNPEPTPAAPEPTPTTPEPTPIVPEPVPTVGPVQTVPTATPVAPTSTVPTPTAALASPTPEMAELSDEDVPLAGEGEKEEPETVIKPAELKDEAVPMAAGKGLSWALINFALMNLAVFESLMLLIGYFIKTKGSSEEDEEEKKKLKKKGIMRIISLPVAVISVIAFILTEDITLPTAFVDRYTILMAVIAIVQTAVAALSRKEVKDEEGQKAEA